MIALLLDENGDEVAAVASGYVLGGVPIARYHGGTWRAMWAGVSLSARYIEARRNLDHPGVIIDCGRLLTVRSGTLTATWGWYPLATRALGTLVHSEARGTEVIWT